MSDIEGGRRPTDQPFVLLKEGPEKGWLLLTSPSRTLVTSDLNDVVTRLREAENAAEEGLHAAGFLSYEAAPAFDPALPAHADGGFPLLWFGVFAEARRLERLPEPPQRTQLPAWRSTVSAEEHAARVEAVRDHIRAGRTYQVNLTHRLHASDPVDPWELFLCIAGENPPYAAYVDTGDWIVCSASPELFFRLDGERIESRPMKGTAARGRWYEEDRQAAGRLHGSAKDRAENVMIVDMVRNDLGRIAETGTVTVPELFTVERYPTVWQMTSTVRARTKASLVDILRATFPPASVTGAPKRRTMEIIRALEEDPRRVYTGAVGYLGPSRQAQFNVAIRTVLAHRPSGRLEYGVGGGIVWDSEPGKEWEECADKERVLHRIPRRFELLETLRWSPGEGFFLLQGHLDRLCRSAEYFDYPVQPEEVLRRLEETVRKLAPTLHRIRLLISATGACTVEASPLREDEAPSVVMLEVAAQPVDPENVFLYHKTTLRDVYDDALRAAGGSDDVLLYNEAGEVTETAIANVAFEIDGTLYTPPVACGLLPGVYRAWLLKQNRVRERKVSVEEALACDRAYRMNSVRGLQPVRWLAKPSHAAPSGL